MRQKVGVGLLGLGTVGSGVVELLARNRATLARRLPCEIEIRRALVRDAARVRGAGLPATALTTDPDAVIDDPEIEIVVEAMGGLTPARELLLKAVAGGKHVVTANKAVIAHHGEEILSAARDAGVGVAFEAAVAGGVPVLKVLREALAGNRIEWVAGIINGTGNFILTEMLAHGHDFDAVLAEAQRLGYAEADPTFDIDGTDAAHKLTILAALAFGMPLAFDSVYREGIAGITSQDLMYADQLGYCVKHLGIARRREEGMELRVHPTLVPKEVLLADVDGVMNAVTVKGDAVGPLTLHGAGAGAEATASAVVGDLIDTVRELGLPPADRAPALGHLASAIDAPRLIPMAEIEIAYYLRLKVDDRSGVLAGITRVLGGLGISIEAIWQKEKGAEGIQVPLVIVTHEVTESAIDQALEVLSGLDTVHGGITRIRMDTLA